VERRKSFFCFFSSFVFHKAREAAKSGLVLFHEAMGEFGTGGWEETFERFERPAAKGHEASIWILSVWKDVEMEADELKEAFAETEEPQGWYFAGRFSEWESRERFFKKSAEGGCTWGQVGYGVSFGEKDNKVYVEWLEKAAEQNNPEAMYRLGDWFRMGRRDEQKAVSYHRAAAELGWKSSMFSLSIMLGTEEGCAKNLRQAVKWGAKGHSMVFWGLLDDTRRALESGTAETLDCDFEQRCYTLGWGLLWYQYDSWTWNMKSDVHAFGNRCLDFYCSCVESQQKSIFTFLLCWNRTTRGVKGPGQMIARRVWEGREDNLVKKFEESAGEE
jgi:hypothetical protein